MPDDASDPYHQQRKPEWLEDATYKAMEQALYRATAFGKDGERVTREVRDVAQSHMPAAPMWMIAEAVQCIVPDPQGLAINGDAAAAVQLSPVSTEQLVSSVSYGLRFDESGRSRKSGHDMTAHLAAAQIVKQLTLSGYVFHKLPADKRSGARLVF